jgi:hypothetical protein
MEEENIQLILRQTDYTEEEAKKKLQLFQNDPIRVIKDYLGIPEKKEEHITSLNQEVYKQIRRQLEQNRKDYIERTKE